MGIYLFWKRIQASFLCQWDEFWTFKIDLWINILNTILEVAMWFFLAKIVDPATLGYAEVGYLPFVLVGSVAIFFVDNVYSNFTEKFSSDRDSGIYKMSYLSNMGILQYFFINFLTSIVFDIITVFIPMIATFSILLQFVTENTIFYLGMSNVVTILVALAIFILGNLGFQLMTVGSTLFLKEGDPVGFFMEQFNRLFSGQLFPTTFLPNFLLFLPKILPAAYIILIWRETLFKNQTIFDPGVINLVIAGFVVNIIIFFIGMYVFYYGINRAKIEERRF